MPRPPVQKRGLSNKHRRKSPGLSKRAPTPSNAGLTSTPRVKLQQQLANKVIGQRPHDSDDSDRLVTRTQTRSRNQRNVEQVFASGGVAKGDQPGVFPTQQERRQRLRSDTEEIIRRSRSKSAEAGKQKMSQSRSNSIGGGNDKTAQGANISTPLVPNSQPVNAAQSRAQQQQSTPAGDASVLGTLKPRRRQPSILHMIDTNNDSSIINPEDEEQFLPDDESTPLTSRDPGHQQTVGQLSTGTLASASRKRKYGADNDPQVISETVQTPPESRPATTTTTPSPEDSMSNSHSPKRQRTSAYEDHDEIMAPPQSSSAESSPQKPSPAVVRTKPKKASVPSTEQLQSLMPTKRRKGTRQRKNITEYDIPEDSTSDDVQIEDESAFLPHKRVTKSRHKVDINFKVNGTVKASNKVKKSNKTAVNAAAAAATAGTRTPAGKSKQTTKSTSTPLKVTVSTPRTPLPLTRNANQENRATTTAPRSRNRNPNSKPSGADGVVVLTRTTRNVGRTQGTVKSSGGSPHRATRADTSKSPTITTGAESDKENFLSGRRTRSKTSAITSSGRHTSSKKRIDRTAGSEMPRPSIEQVPTNDTMQIDPSTEPATTEEGENEVQHVTETPPPAADRHLGRDDKQSADVHAWKKRWGNIDDWSLEYEEVDVSTGSSSPLLKAGVV